MKRILLFMSLVFALNPSFSNAQFIPSTHDAVCAQCVPSGWTKDNLGFYVSNTSSLAGMQNYKWTNGPILPPPGKTDLTNFLTQYVSPTVQTATASTTISNLVVGAKYKVRYYVISLSTSGASYGSSATVTLTSGAQAAQTTNFVQGGGIGVEKVDTWVKKYIEFTATATTAKFSFSGKGDTQAGYVGLSISTNDVFACKAGLDQVKLKEGATIATNICPKPTVNLNDLVVSEPPAGCQLVWWRNNTHTGQVVDNVVDPIAAGNGQYFAFFQDVNTSCLNTDLSTAVVNVQIQPCPDLTPTISINGLSFTNASKDFVVNLFETKGTSTTSPISFRISKTGGFTISYPTVNSVSNVFGGKMNENGSWTFAEDANFITASSSKPIPANGQAVVGFSIKRKDGTPIGTTQNIKASIIGGKGGDDNSSNNSIITSVSTN